jgi:formate hydrogenlyase transcriptional activator
MIETVGASATEIYEAVLSLSRSIAGRTDLAALLSGVRQSLRRIVRFDHLGLILHDADAEAMQGHILNEPGNPVITSLRMPVEADPAGWVWLNQQPLILSRLDAETRWPEFISRSRAEFGISTLILVPLTAGANRLGAFGFSSVAPYEPGTAEMEFLERVATEFAVAVEGFLARQAAVRERDRLRTLFDITNALVSKLAADELFSAISDQLSKVIRHDHAVLTLCNEKTGVLDVYALHSADARLSEAGKGPFDPAGMPAAEVLATGKPVVARDVDIDRYPNPNFRRFVALGLKSICSVPLIARDRIIGTLALSRTTNDAWTSEDVAFLTQVAGQIAIAVENSLAYRELSEMKERLATEKLYPPRSQLWEHGGTGTRLPIHFEDRSDRCANRFDRSHSGGDRNGKRTRRPGGSRTESAQEGQLRQGELRGDSRHPSGK